MAITVVSYRCPKNHRCPAIRVCPAGAMSQNGYSAPIVDESKCTNCGRCTRVCPTGAIQREERQATRNTRRSGF